MKIGMSTGVYTIDVFAGTGECLRLAVTTQPADLDLVIVSPNGTVFSNDGHLGGAPDDLQPLVKIGSGPSSGWHTVHLAYFFSPRH
jgi:hypothetical protein